MKKIKPWLSTFLICLVLALLAPMEAQAAEVMASGSCGENLTWTLTTDGVLTISGEGEMEEGTWDAYRESITEVVIEPGVTSIGYSVFDGCSGLTSVALPDSVTSIGYNAFADCMNLTEINVDVGNRNYSSADGVLFNKDATIIWCYPARKTGNAYYIPDSVTSIEDYAFRDCTSLARVTIPDGVTNIGSYTFRGCTSLGWELRNRVRKTQAILVYRCNLHAVSTLHLQ